MGCDFPLKAFRSQEFNPETGRYALTFNPSKSLSGTAINLPCGRCTGCKLEKSRQWAVRCQHEAQMHPENCWLTLTYNRENLPVDYSVHPRVMQLFFKRLRKSLYPKQVRFYLGAEYGDLNHRPHYHVILFNHDFHDKIFYENTPQGHTLYTSPSLSILWPYGLATLGPVTFQTAAYTARYTTKKQTGPQASSFYLRQHPDHGFICRVRPEFSLMSRRPGIGASWIEKYKSDTYPADTVITNERPAKPPRYYDQQLTEEELHRVTTKRKLAAKQRPIRPRTYNAEMAHAEVRDAKISTLKRKL